VGRSEESHAGTRGGYANAPSNKKAAAVAYNPVIPNKSPFLIIPEVNESTKRTKTTPVTEVHNKGHC
jgi:hypothetical protein